ncbi:MULTISPECIES: tryptophan dimethylallyltransferase family protein [Streptomyces]|uniref:Prenyltransferase n=1 Tax=Streptomyces cadmiisoli TaxID=2184053 RepID=A0A2Z4JEY8_9ACTN|nr:MULTISPECIES: tryptophan dimethylallyltransferase family protein [Streptomyces]AWW43103.1 prenyltransferase [Streptomyces cadmiisoli]
MSGARVGAESPGIPTLGSFTGGQSRRLCAAAGLSQDDCDTYAQVLSESLGTASVRSLDLPPPNRTFLSDDHTPVEFSLSFRPGAAPAVRVLVEPGCGAADLARNGRTGLEAVRAMASRWRFTTEPLDAVADLFLPSSPQGDFALWCALELRPGGIPQLKVYLNPAASGREHRAETVREALRRLGHHQAFGAMPEADGYPFLALDLGDWEQPRVKVYLSHDDMTADRAALLSRMDPGPDPADLEEFFRAAAGTRSEADRLTRRPALTCHAFTDTAAARPSGFTLHIPVRDYARHDKEVLARATNLLHRHGMDAGPLDRALAALTRRRPEDGVGLISYLALAHQHGRPARVTTYLSCEAYAVRPPNVMAPDPVEAMR